VLKSGIEFFYPIFVGYIYNNKLKLTTMEFYPGFETAPKRRTNKVTIKITGISDTDVPTRILLQKLCLLRTAEKVGDIETVNHYQLGKLNQNGVQYVKIA
jgi:hypothetical protein